MAKTTKNTTKTTVKGGNKKMPKVDELLSKVAKPSGEKAVTESAEELKRMKELEEELQRLKKKLGGRPKKAPTEKASVRVSFYITPTQKREIRELLGADVKSESVLAKNLLLDWLENEKANKEDKKA